MASSYDSYLKQIEENQEEDKKKVKAASDEIYDSQEQHTQQAYQSQMDTADKSYDSLYKENAVQKLINEREIAENMANLGLSDSGLNRTQQTAAQLSYANNKNAIDLQRRASVDELAQKMADAIATIRQNKIAANAKIDQEFKQTATENATALYNASVNGGSDGSGSGSVTAEATQQQKLDALEAYNTGGYSGLEQYLSSMPASIDIQAMYDYAVTYGNEWAPDYELYSGWAITEDTNNGPEDFGQWFTFWNNNDGVDHNDKFKKVVNGETVTHTYDELAKLIDDSSLPQEQKKELKKALQKQSKK